MELQSQSVDNAEVLSSHRERIDEIDNQIVELLNERAKNALAIGAIKASANLPIFSVCRENEVLAKVMELNQGPHSDEQMVDYFMSIMNNSKDIQYNSLKQNS